LNTFDAILLGIVQGFTEFLPISSDGHLVMTQTVLGIEVPGIVLEVVLHVATLLAVVIVYRARLLQLIVGFFGRDRDAWRYVAALVVATLPAVFVGLFLKDAAEATFDQPYVAGFGLLWTATMLFTTRWALRRAPAAEIEGVERREQAAEHRAHAPLASTGPTAPPYLIALVMGVFQAIAILPGVSRSGGTITVGLWSRLSGEKAAEFSFLMSIPAIIGAVILQIPDMREGADAIGTANLAIGFVAALVSGVVAIKSLVWLLRRQAFHHFAWYAAAVGIAFLIYLSVR
jgi:undecaprenyl-diphosphatase